MAYRKNMLRFGVRSASFAAALMMGTALSSAAELEKLVYMTSWFAQADFGGFYQAKATGLYEKEGLDVEIKMGGPQVNGMQLLLAGESDVYNGYDFQVLKGVEQGFPLKTIAAMYQKASAGMLTHNDVTSLDDLKDRTLLIATATRTSWWPWLKEKYDLSDDQVKPYTFNIQPFIIDKDVAQQAVLTSEPFALEEQGVPYNFYLLADEGYPPYGITLVTRDDVISERPDALKRFIKASAEGWKSYLADPAPGNALIKEANPRMTDEMLDFAIKRIKEAGFITGGDAATDGIGIMTEDRWRATYEYMVSSDLLKAETDWKKAFTVDLVKDLNVKPD